MLIQKWVVGFVFVCGVGCVDCGIFIIAIEAQTPMTKYQFSIFVSLIDLALYPTSS